MVKLSKSYLKEPYLSVQNISENVSHLDHYFQKHMTLDMEFDERLFIN